MPYYTKEDFPASMKNMEPSVRNKAVEILNALLEENMEEEIAIPTSISRARDWARNNSNQKNPAPHQYVIPHNGKWAVKAEGATRVTKEFETKKDAVEEGKQISKNNHTVLTVQLKDGRIQETINYNN